MTIDRNSRLRPTIRLNQHFAVLSKHILTLVHNPFWVVLVIVEICRNVRYIILWVTTLFYIVGVVVTLVFVVIAITVLDADIKLAIFLVRAIHITNITTTEDVAVLTCQLLRCTYSTTMYMHLCLSEDITIGVERTTFTEVVIASTATEDIAVYFTFIESYIGLACLINSLQGTYAIILSGSIDDTTSDGSNLTATKEGVTYVTAIHLDVGDIHTTVVDITTTEDTATIIQTVSSVARPGLVVQFLLIVVRAYLFVVEISISSGFATEVTITDKSIVKCNVGSTKYGTTLTTTVSITLDSRKTIDEIGAVFLSDDDVCLTKDITCCSSINCTSVITYATSPATTIDVTCRTTLDISIGRSFEWFVEVISSNVIFVVYRTLGSCGVDILGDRTTGCSVNITRIGSVGVTQATTVGVSTAETTIIHIAADVSTLVDDHVGVVFLAVSDYGQIIVQTGVGIAHTDRKVDSLRFWSFSFLLFR